MKTIRWGIIGCGDVCEVKSGPGLQKAENSALVAVMRRDGEKAKDFATRHNVPRWYDDAQKLIDDPEVDAVYIATPPGSHAEYALQVAEAGKPIYVEKPMARNFAECEAMFAAAQTANVPLFVAFYRRALPRFLKVKEILDSGGIGEVRAVTVQHFQKSQFTDARTAQAMNPQDLPWRVRPEVAGAGLFMDLAAHTLDLLDYLLGPIEVVGGLAQNQAALYSAEDIVAGHWQHSGGALGTGIWCFSAGHNYEMNEIVGSTGCLRFSTFGAQAVFGEQPIPGAQTIFGAQTIEWGGISGVQTFDIEHPQHIQQPLIQSIVDELNDKGQCPSTGVSGARTNRVMDAMLESYRQK